MELPYYEITAGRLMMSFEFVSEGAYGRIPKLVKYSPTYLKNVYNLAFGDKNLLTGNVNDAAISNNGDREKILATVVATIYMFTNKYPERCIYATGNTSAKTRLYRMGITKYLKEIQKDFELYGLSNNEWELFEKEKNYEAFLARRKSSKFEYER